MSEAVWEGGLKKLWVHINENEQVDIKIVNFNANEQQQNKVLRLWRQNQTSRLIEKSRDLFTRWIWTQLLVSL